MEINIKTREQKEFEEWAADIYDMGGGVAITMGYAPFGSVRPSYEVVKRYENAAEKNPGILQFQLWKV